MPSDSSHRASRSGSSDKNRSNTNGPSAQSSSLFSGSASAPAGALFSAPGTPVEAIKIDMIIRSAGHILPPGNIELHPEEKGNSQSKQKNLHLLKERMEDTPNEVNHVEDLDANVDASSRISAATQAEINQTFHSSSTSKPRHEPMIRQRIEGPGTEEEEEGEDQAHLHGPVKKRRLEQEQEGKKILLDKLERAGLTTVDGGEISDDLLKAQLADSIDSADWEDLLEKEESELQSYESRLDDLRWFQWQAINRFSDEEIETMTAYLKEKGLLNFVKRYVIELKFSVLRLLNAFQMKVPTYYRDPNLDEFLLMPILKLALTKTLRKRERLREYSTWTDAIELIRRSKRILVLTGAGISVSCGIPDFRSTTGLYAKLKDEGEYDLDDPQQMFELSYFKETPAVFYSFAHQIYPSNFTPSPCHRWIKLLEDKGKLLRNYTQNIDTLESQVGIKNVLQCHGSFATASCLRCRRQMPGSAIESDIMRRTIPRCTPCIQSEEREVKQRVKERKKRRGKQRRGGWAGEDSDEEGEEEDLKWRSNLPPAVIKPDITFFGEPLDDRFDRCLFADRESVDLLLVIGSSLQVAPVSEVLAHLPHSVPQILINKTPLKYFDPDINLLGDADGIVRLLSEKLEWNIPIPELGRAQNASAEPSREPTRVGNTHYWLFDGAELDLINQHSKKRMECPKEV
ncbi:Sirtuin 5 and related class III sirtuins (SIR2 family) [Phaffia rhodozyma]|uniref:Sirtuin 5 and related class III sirtuins (SIR2 family) n=1 Tax=Phaffia rhodozyma TaxID=264483 RepID=A0A0F7SMI8_PHARH|nr:Sirtuin 5 and related class III sirtuins (SIR2 family) [Phaffia rhodozyma]